MIGCIPSRTPPQEPWNLPRNPPTRRHSLMKRMSIRRRHIGNRFFKRRLRWTSGAKEEKDARVHLKFLTPSPMIRSVVQLSSNGVVTMEVPLTTLRRLMITQGHLITSPQATRDKQVLSTIPITNLLRLLTIIMTLGIVAQLSVLRIKLHLTALITSTQLL